MIFKAHKYQPLVCWVELSLSNLDRYFLKEPEVLMDAEFSFEGSTIVGDARINLFDDVAILIEKSIFEVVASHKGVDVWGVPIGTVRWGYSLTGSEFEDGEYSSPLYEFMLTRYTLSMGREYFTMSMEARITNHASLNNHTKMEGTVQQCFEKYCEVYDLELVISPPLDHSRMIGFFQTEETRYSSIEVQNHSRRSDFEFIRTLAENCVDHDGIGGYDIYLSPSSEKKSGTLYVYSIKGSKELTMQVDNYIVRDADSVVMEWSPTIEYATPTSYDKKQSVERGVQFGTGSTMHHAANNHLINERLPNLGNLDIQKNLDDFWNGVPIDKRYTQMVGYAGEMESLAIEDDFSKINPMATSEPIMSMNRNLSKYISSCAGLYQASMTIEGDPKFILPKVIRVTYTLPHSYKWRTEDEEHYTSGAYGVVSATHNVGTGGYSLSLQLQRNMIEIPGVGISLPDPQVKSQAS